MSTDTFGEFMGVRSDPIGEKITADLIKLTAHVPMTGTVAASAPNGYVLERPLNDSFRAVFLLLDKGMAVRRVAAAADGSVRTGDFLVAGGRRCRRRCAQSRPAWTSSALTSPLRRAPMRFASRASRCFSATAAATWTRAGRA